jgi:hypothetical protein
MILKVNYNIIAVYCDMKLGYADVGRYSYVASDDLKIILELLEDY